VVEATPEQLGSFSRALAARLGSLSRRALCERVAMHSGESVTPQAVSLWLLAQSEPSRRKVFALEKALDVAPGTLARHLGYLPPEARPRRTVLEALESDARLDEKAVRMLAAAYREAARV
jgi:transcriptional regulator with XRE-family HTH domain